MPALSMPNSLYVRSAFQILNAYGERTDERLTDLVIHYCTLYGVEPHPYIQDALEYFHSPMYEFLHGND